MADLIEENNSNFEYQSITFFTRAVFTVYWQDAFPSSEVFYFKESPFREHDVSIEDLEQSVIDIFTANTGTTPLKAIYIAHRNIKISFDDKDIDDWRIII